MDSEEEYGQSIAINVIVILSPLEAEVAGKAFFEQSNACDNSQFPISVRGSGRRRPIDEFPFSLKVYFWLHTL